jgi:uncharacterized membrane protein
MESWSGALLRASAIGAVAGFRSMTAPAIAAHALARSEDPLGLSGPRPPAWCAWIEQPAARRALTALAGGEMAADKTPWVPARDEPAPLAARAASGAFSAAALARKRPLLPVVLAGGVAAIATTLASRRLRAELVQATGLPDPLVAIIEDALALALGRAAVP